MESIVFELVKSFGCAAIGAIAGIVISKLNSKATESGDAATGEREGVRVLLWDKLRCIHSEAMERGGMSVEDRRYAEDVYSAYHKLSGNGTGTRLYEESMSLPVLD